jgi:hypothetical protein
MTFKIYFTDIDECNVNSRIWKNPVDVAISWLFLFVFTYMLLWLTSSITQTWIKWYIETWYKCHPGVLEMSHWYLREPHWCVENVTFEFLENATLVFWGNATLVCGECHPCVLGECHIDMWRMSPLITCNKKNSIYLPWQDFWSGSNINPGLQPQVTDPAVLIQIAWQSPFLTLHSSISVK